ncbi:MAG TPA: DUF2291 family protein [Nocardioidaceae bacterium]|nr:DUF2291 family protein [Nocardioidaceae bacterium]
MGRTNRLSGLRIGAVVAFAALLVAMALNTRFVTPDELASIGPEKFDPEQTAADLYDEGNEVLPGRATPMPELLNALHENVEETAKKRDAARPSDTTYVFAVSGKAKIVGSQGSAIELEVEGIPAATSVSLAKGPAVNGTVLRDALGFEFGDAPNQTAYQSVGNVLGNRMEQQLNKGLPDAPKNKTVQFLGLLSVTDTGAPLSPAKPVSVQPVKVEVSK